MPTDLYIFATDWVKRQFKPFSADDLRENFEGSGGSIKHGNCVGGVFSGLVQEKLIFEYGRVKSKRKAAKGNLIRTYISKEYREKQQRNATKNNTLNLFD